MGRNIFIIFVGHALVCQVLSANLHPALQQYILGLSQPTPSMSYPPVAIAKQNSPHNIQSLAALASMLSPQTLSSVPVKPPTVSSSPSISPASLITALSDHSTAGNFNFNSLTALATLLSPTNVPKASHAPPNVVSALESPSNSVDSALLNNLAIALQLLLVSNIINGPQQETNSEPVVGNGYPIHEFKESVAPIPVSYGHSTPQNHPVTTPSNYMSSYEHSTPNSNYHHYESSYGSPPQIPNANFVGSSTFTDSNPFGATIPPATTSSSRGGFSLMSPYEALSPSSPYSDPILSSGFGSVMTSKKDFQSPYSSIMAADNKDLFNLSDFF